MSECMCTGKSQRRKLALEDLSLTPSGQHEPPKAAPTVPTTWSCLPADLLCQAAGLLNRGCVVRLRLVCKSWRKALDAHTTDLAPKSCMTPFWVRLPRLFPNLQALDLSHTCGDLNDGLMIVLSSLSSLATLRLANCKHVSCMGLQNCIMDLTRLQELDLSGCANIMEEGLTHIALMDGLQTLGRLPKGLTSLNVSHCGLTEDNCTILAHMTALKTLHLDGCPTTPLGIAKLSSLVLLESLSLVACQIDDNAVENLTSFTQLRHLDLSMNPAVMGHSLGVLAEEVPSLFDFRLRGCKELSSDSVASMQGFRSLSQLDLQGCVYIGDSAMHDLRVHRITSLTALNLDECHAITNHGLEDLSKVEGLRYVSLKGCGHVTQSGIKYLLRAGMDVHTERIGSMLPDHGHL